MSRAPSPPVLTLALSAWLLSSPAAFAQSAPTHDNNVSLNPITMTFGMFNVEYGRRLDTTKTLGMSTSYFSFDDADYVNANALFRYYPREAFRGFYLGGRSGVYRVSARHESAIAFGAGPELGYDWLLGARGQISVSVGVGATRLFGGDIDGVSLTLPYLRLINVGVTF